jgi:phytanoyl-CoA hydroxylase
MLWIALDDATLQNGCLYVLPGSHRTSRFDTGGATSSARIDALFDAYPEWRAIEPAPVEVGAGGAVFLSGMVAHAAGPNMTRGRRRAFSILFMPDDAVFNGHQSALPDAVASRLQIGDPIADDEHLPLLYSRRLHRHVNS